MKKICTLILLSILFLVLDNALMPFLAIKGSYPSLLFIFAICYSIIDDSWNAILIGIFTGFLQDIYLNNALGINMFINMLMCFIASSVGKSIFKDKALIPIVSSFFFILIKGCIIFCILYILGTKFSPVTIIYTGIYGTVITIFMYKRVYKLCQKRYMIKNWKF